jgi:hypothetical protein
MSPLVLGAVLATCPVGTIDEVDPPHLAVLGATGVRVVGVHTVEIDRGRVVRDGDRIELSPDGRCRVAPPDPTLRLRIEARLRALRR